MTAFADRQASILSYCRIDDPTPEDLALLEGFYADAVSYMEGAGVAEPLPGLVRLAQYNICVNALVLDAWENRGVQCADKSFPDNKAFRRRLNQLKRTEPVTVSDSDTEG